MSNLFVVVTLSLSLLSLTPVVLVHPYPTRVFLSTSHIYSLSIISTRVGSNKMTSPVKGDGKLSELKAADARLLIYGALCCDGKVRTQTHLFLVQCNI